MIIEEKALQNILCIQTERTDKIFFNKKLKNETKIFFINKMKFILFSTYVIIILVISTLLQHSVKQYKNYDITNGTGPMFEMSIDFCLLNFMYNDKKEIKDLPYSTIGKKGLFSIQIAISRKIRKITSLSVPKIFFMEQNSKYFCMSFFCVSLCCLFLFCFKIFSTNRTPLFFQEH